MGTGRRGVARATQHVDELLSSLLAWPIGGFLDAFVYVCVLGLELRVAERLGGQQCQFLKTLLLGRPFSTRRRADTVDCPFWALASGLGALGRRLQRG